VAATPRTNTNTRSSSSRGVPASIRINLVGDKYGKLTVVGFGGYRGTAILWRCKCECGKRGDYYRANLRSGNSKQCAACSKKQFVTQGTSHGMYGTPTYRTWERIIRSGQVSKRWQAFENFFEDVGQKTSVNHHFVRKNTTQPWKPGNGEWTHKSKARKNSRTAKQIRYKGRCQSLSDWAREVGISRTSLRRRFEAGWTKKQALETPATH
jgi:hypothetical protein